MKIIPVFYCPARRAIRLGMNGIGIAQPFTEEDTRLFIKAISYGWCPKTKTDEYQIEVVPIGVFRDAKRLTSVVVRDQNNQPHIVTVPVEGKNSLPRRAYFDPDDRPRYGVEGGRTVTPPQPQRHSGPAKLTPV